MVLANGPTDLTSNVPACQQFINLFRHALAVKPCNSMNRLELFLFPGGFGLTWLIVAAPFRMEEGLSLLLGGFLKYS